MKVFLQETVLFGVIGTAGFIVDTAVLYLLKDTLGPLAARVPSFLAAVLTTWWLNRRVTFAHRPSGLKKTQEFQRYLTIMLVGGAINYVVYAVLLSSFETVRTHPVVGVAAGSIAGMMANLLAARCLLFR